MNADILQKFNVTVTGEGRQTIVLAHEFGSDQTAWRYQAEVLKSRYRLVLFDYLGCGKTDHRDYSPLHYRNLESYRDDVLAIYRALGLTDTIFVGHSISAGIGMLIARKHPQLIGKLIVIAASPRYLNDEKYTGGFEPSDLNTLYDMIASNYLGWTNGFAPLATANSGRPEIGREFAGSLSAMRPDIAQSAARVIFEADYRFILNTIQQPVFILQSQRDIVVPMEAAYYLADQLLHSKLTLLNAEGHLPHWSSPDKVTKAIWEFGSDEAA
ncbi:MAG: alpha/beta hydrolase [Chloroflexi bacterium]|nr:alpha/beta hydrolase [Chloroflexota bacterium]MCC6893673.1 alpha/beta hydrolase [Anaerolineae bacterium]